MAANSSAYKRGGGSLQEVRESKRLKQTRLADLFLPSKHQNRVLATKIDSKPEVICPLKISEESSIVQNYSPGHFGNDAPPGRDFLCTVDNTKESAALASETGGVYCSHAGGENETLPGPQCQEGEALVCSPVISLSSLSGSLSQRCGVVSMLDIDPLPSEKPTDMSISTYRDNSPPAVQSSNSNVPIETWKPGKMAKTAAASAQQRGAPLSSYEQERLDRVKRNEEFLRSLGIDHDMKTFNTEKKKMPSKKSQPKRPSVPSGPLRRSSRISGLVGEGGTPSIDKSNIDSGINGDTVAVTDPEPIEYVDTSIFRYICEESPTTSILKPHVDGPRRLLGFQVLKGELRDSSLSKIYSMDVSHGPRPLLAAAGHLGSIAVFPAWDFAQEGTCNQEGDHNEEHSQLNDGDIVEPLLSWRAGRGWISQVQFLLDQFLEEATLLLSSSNDHTVVLWNLNKEQQQIGTKRNCNPCIVSQTDSLHSQGIFGMHEKGLRLMTASKDHTLVYSTIGPASITKERTIEGHHESPLRSVRFRDFNILADSGADANICLLDLRLQNACTLTMSGDHASAVNVVQWHPTNEHLLLSASHDPHILLHDVRFPSRPLQKLSGHMSPTVKRSRQIYRPAFTWNGKAVVTSGEGSKKLSLYDVDSGKTISRGHVGHDASLVMDDCRQDCTGSLWMAGKAVVQLAPLWQSED